MRNIKDLRRPADLSVVREAKRNPVTFAQRILGQDPWRVQREILASVAANQLTAVQSCHASAKTYNAAAVALWFMLQWKESLVITTAPTFRQVKVMWGEIAEARKRSKHVGFGQCAFAVAPGNFFDSHDATAVTVDAPHGVQKEDEKPPQGNEFKAPYSRVTTRYACRTQLRAMVTLPQPGLLHQREAVLIEPFASDRNTHRLSRFPRALRH